jgi:hypothetical protein
MTFSTTLLAGLCALFDLRSLMRRTARRSALGTLVLAPLAVTSGCCKDASLLRSKDTDEVIEIKVRREPEGITDLLDRFHAVASMVDWSFSSANHEWGPYKVVQWDPSDGGSMTIPIVSWCPYGFPKSNDHVTVRFDDAGSAASVTRQQSRLPDDYWSFQDYNFHFPDYQDPWNAIATQSAISSVTGFIEKNGTSLIEIGSRHPTANRYISMDLYGYWPEHLRRPHFSISTDPPIEFVVVQENGPHRYTPDLAGGYMVQEMDFAVRTKKPRSLRFAVRAAQDTQFVPSEAMYCEYSIILAPHDGVSLRLELVEGSEANP